MPTIPLGHALRRGLIVALALCVPAPARAQLFELSRFSDLAAQPSFASGAAYDPVHDCYLVVSAGASVTGRFIDRNGAPLGGVVLDAREGIHVAAVAYSPHVSDGGGGVGGFVAIWTATGGSGLFARIVSFPHGLVGPPTLVRATGTNQFELKASIAYSPVHRTFLVGIGLVGAGSLPTLIVRLDLNAQPIDDTPLSFEPSFSCANLEFELACNEVAVEWNPTSNEFGVLYNQGFEKTLARVSGDGVILSRTTLGISPYFGALAVNTTTGNYFAVGSRGDLALIPGATQTTDGAEVSPAGAILSTRFVTSSGVMRLSYSRASGTFLLAGIDTAFSHVRLLELDEHGVPVGTELTFGLTPAVFASHASSREWLVASQHTNSIIGTRTQFGGSTAPSGGCVTPDPFVAMGGGTCVNGGWYPPGMLVPTPPPVFAGGCLTPDPFTALGGGTCVNGGWYPPSTPPPSAPPVIPGGCLTPDPFVAIGGGICENGGWRPKG